MVSTKIKSAMSWSLALSSQSNQVETVRETTLENDVRTNAKFTSINNFFRATVLNLSTYY